MAKSTPSTSARRHVVFIPELLNVLHELETLIRSGLHSNVHQNLAAQQDRSRMRRDAHAITRLYVEGRNVRGKPRDLAAKLHTRKLPISHQDRGTVTDGAKDGGGNPIAPFPHPGYPHSVAAMGAGV
jgi:hypothetical protein